MGLNAARKINNFRAFFEGGKIDNIDMYLKKDFF